MLKVDPILNSFNKQLIKLENLINENKRKVSENNERINSLKEQNQELLSEVSRADVILVNIKDLLTM